METITFNSIYVLIHIIANETEVTIPDKYPFKLRLWCLIYILLNRYVNMKIQIQVAKFKE